MAGYRGCFRPFVPAILHLHRQGLTPGKISRRLGKGIDRADMLRKGWHEASRNSTWSYPSPAMVKHIITIETRAPRRAPGCKPRTRPLDMGGPRGRWLVFRLGDGQP